MLDYLAEGAKEGIAEPSGIKVQRQMEPFPQGYSGSSFGGGGAILKGPPLHRAPRSVCSHLRKGPFFCAARAWHILWIICISGDPHDEEIKAQRGEGNRSRTPMEAMTLSELNFLSLSREGTCHTSLDSWRMRHKEAGALIGSLRGKHPHHPPVPKTLSERF